MAFNMFGRRGVVLMASTLILGAVYGCSSTGPAQSSASTALKIEPSTFGISVENTSGAPMLDVRVNIVPVGAATVFTAYQGRLENTEKKEFPFGMFAGRDGTPYDRRVVKAKAIQVTAKGMSNETFEAEMPWK